MFKLSLMVRVGVLALAAGGAARAADVVVNKDRPTLVPVAAAVAGVGQFVMPLGGC